MYKSKFMNFVFGMKSLSCTELRLECLKNFECLCLLAGWLAGWHFRPLWVETSTYSTKTNNINFKKRFVAY